MIKLDPGLRWELASKTMQLLVMSVPKSQASLRGSLGTSRADQYSDIDIFWEVPDTAFPLCLEGLKNLLNRAHPVESLRHDPDFYNSDRRRLVFVRFAGVSLFWRLDLSVMAYSLHKDEHYDENNPLARGGWEQWSWPESALSNAVSSGKALLRGQPDTVQELLNRAYQKVGLEKPESELQAQILTLAESIAQREPGLELLAKEVKQLVINVLANP